ncbi:ribosome biogenesis GTPase Der [Pseudodesulfovibrio senegalensis]|uniref:GTPase Der n=1 Tax=Pseudodesulfovibrio senegalensis TaxID=1721087 RepID=A0A6N6N023_9BACT|nr:ribosome biogenesis GTPase Der [Pseudodesulfovibrio senegalensis]KAB1440262.1 ribosome biogenesis GTPase Der [Pseudodesulfovibrio senegalensis]
MLPIVALIGRPNVGKSTLFNRLLRRSQAITHDMPGVTRDRIYGECTLKDVQFSLVDTGGMVLESEAIPELSKDFEDEIFEQAREALEEAHAIIFVVDGKSGLTPLDMQAAEYIRRSDKPVLMLVNKVDGYETEAEALGDFYRLGLEMMPVSAAHGYNLPEVRDTVRRMVRDLNLPEEQDDGIDRGLRVSMLGRPNAGKSSMVNALMGKDRLIVSDVAGTTRDSIDVTAEIRGKRYTFVDTAGVRRRANITDSLERLSVLRALKNSRRSEVTILVIDATLGVGRQDKRLIEFLAREKVPFLVAVNKIDLVDRDETDFVMRGFEHELRIVPHVPVIKTSTLKGVGLKKLLPAAEKIVQEGKTRVGTGELNRAMHLAIQKHQPPVVKRRRAKFFYMTQAGDENVLTFVFFVNDHTLIKSSYERYLENQLRKMFSIAGAPINLIFRSSHDKKEWEKRRGISAIGKAGPGKDLGSAKKRSHVKIQEKVRRDHWEKRQQQEKTRKK